MAFGDANLFLASAARTASGDSGAGGVACEKGLNLNVLVNVSAASGTTPSMTLSIQWSHDAGATWAVSDPADAFTAITAAGVVIKQFAAKAPLFRLVWVLTGTTPSFTFQASKYITE